MLSLKWPILYVWFFWPLYVMYASVIPAKPDFVKSFSSLKPQTLYIFPERDKRARRISVPSPCSGPSSPTYAASICKRPPSLVEKPPSFVLTLMPPLTVTSTSVALSSFACSSAFSTFACC